MNEFTQHRRRLVIDAIRRGKAAGQQPTFAQLEGALALGHADLVEEIGLLKDEQLVSQDDQGRLDFIGDESDLPELPAPETPDASASEEEEEVPAALRPDPDAELPDDPDVPAAAESLPRPPADVATLRQLPPASVQLTRGMVRSLEAEALGKLILAGISERDGAPFVLVIE